MACGEQGFAPLGRVPQGQMQHFNVAHRSDSDFQETAKRSELRKPEKQKSYFVLGLPYEAAEKAAAKKKAETLQKRRQRRAEKKKDESLEANAFDNVNFSHVLTAPSPLDRGEVNGALDSKWTANVRPDIYFQQELDCRADLCRQASVRRQNGPRQNAKLLAMDVTKPWWPGQARAGGRRLQG